VRAALSSTITLPVFTVGSYVIIFAPGTRQHSLQSPFVGPCKVVAAGVDSRGMATGFYSMRECLPGHSPSQPDAFLYERPLSSHVSDMRPFVWGERGWAEIMEARLPEGYGFVVEVLRGPDGEGQYECRFFLGPGSVAQAVPVGAVLGAPEDLFVQQ